MQALVTALAAASQHQRAESVVQWMLGYGLKPNVRTYTALLTALGNGNQWERAVEMLRLMQTPEWGSVQPNAYTYSALLKSLGEYGQWQLAETVFSYLEHQVLSAGGTELPADLSAMAAAAGRDQARASAATSSSNSSGSGDAAYVPGWPYNTSHSAQGLPSSHVALDSRPSSRNSASSVAAGDASSSSGSSSTGVAASSTSDSGGSWTSPAQLNGLDLGVSVAAVTATSAPNGQPAQDQLIENQRRRSFSLFTRPSASSRASQQAGLAFGSDLVSHQLTHTSTQQQQQQQGGGFEAAAEAATSANRGSAAASASRPRQPSSAVVNEVVCGALMLAYERAGKWEEAVRVLQRARRLGIEPNTVMYNTAISAAGKAGQSELANQLFKEVRGRISCKRYGGCAGLHLRYGCSVTTYVLPVGNS